MHNFTEVSIAVFKFGSTHTVRAWKLHSVESLCTSILIWMSDVHFDLDMHSCVGSLIIRQIRDARWHGSKLMKNGKRSIKKQVNVGQNTLKQVEKISCKNSNTAFPQIRKNFSKLASVTNFNVVQVNSNEIFAYVPFQVKNAVSAHTKKCPTRHSHTKSFITISTWSDIYKYAFLPWTVTEWNQLPQSLIDWRQLKVFKEQLKQHFK